MAATSGFGQGATSFNSVSLSTAHLLPTHTFSLLPTSFISPINISSKSISTFNITHAPKKSGSGRASIRAMTTSFDSLFEDTVKRTVSDNPVVVYSKSYCAYSSEVKKVFKQLGVQPHVIELDHLGLQGGQLQEVLEKMTGQRTVPNVFIGAKHIGGYTDTVKLHQNGKLENLLSDAGVKKDIQHSMSARLSNAVYTVFVQKLHKISIIHTTT